MNKTDLASHIATAAEIPQSKAVAAIDTLIESAGKALKAGDQVMLIGFGTFSVSKHKARMGRNPQTGKTIQIAARRVVKFKAGRDLKKLVNKKAA